MRLQLASLAIALPLLLVACSHTPDSGKPAPITRRCNAELARFAIGRSADATLQNEARTQSGATALRVLQPNQVVTMEFNAERLNLTVDQTGRVTRVNCG